MSHPPQFPISTPVSTQFPPQEVSPCRQEPPETAAVVSYAAGEE
jgi:hypothetical protein